MISEEENRQRNIEGRNKSDTLKEVLGDFSSVLLWNNLKTS
jgi:hypothetical protein